MAGYLRVDAERRDGVSVLRIAGDLDASMAGALTDHTNAVLRAIPGVVLVDLSGLSFIDPHRARLGRSAPGPRGQEAGHTPLRPVRSRVLAARMQVSVSQASIQRGSSVTSPASRRANRERAASSTVVDSAVASSPADRSSRDRPTSSRVRRTFRGQDRRADMRRASIRLTCVAKQFSVIIS